MCDPGMFQFMLNLALYLFHTAGVGVVINAVTAWLFMKDKEKTST